MTAPAEEMASAIYKGLAMDRAERIIAFPRTPPHQPGNRSNRSALPSAIFARSAADIGSVSRNALARTFDAKG